MYRFACAGVALGLLFSTGCDVIFFGSDTTVPQSELRSFQSEKEYSDYVRNEVDGRNTMMTAPDVGMDFLDGPAVGPPILETVSGEAGSFGGDGADSVSDSAAQRPTPPAGQAENGGRQAAGDDADFSQTTVQEVGVDEADVVKTDGKYLYIIHQGRLRIVQATPPEGLALASELELTGYGREMYLHDGKVIALTETGGGYFFVGEGVADDGVAVDVEPGGSVEPAIDVRIGIPDVEMVYQYERPKTIVTIVDASSPAEPIVLSETKLDGTQTSSRMIGGVLHLVLANYQHYYLDVMPMFGRMGFDTGSVDPMDLLPRYERVDPSGPKTGGTLVTWRELYHPEEPDGFGMVTVVSMNVDQGGAMKAVGIVAEPGNVYSSTQALYLTDTDYRFNGNVRESTAIHKLAYENDHAVPVASGIVPGRILNQYSMSEFDGYFRVATTVGTTFSVMGRRDGPFNNIYVLDEIAGRLEVVGSVENIAPGEDIKSARFMGNRGYLVTFEQIDPLFTLDLSDPTNPLVVGELKVPGFSTFILPLDKDHLLTVGQYIPERGFWPWGVQLSVFNVSDFANPALEHQVILGQQSGAYSEALYNPKALTYFASEGLLALPISIQELSFNGVVFEDGPGDIGSDIMEDEAAAPPPTDGVEVPFQRGGFDGVIVYRLSTGEGFEELGRISTRVDEPFFWTAFTRGVFIGDHAYAVTNSVIRSAPINDVNADPFEVIFEPEFGFSPIIVDVGFGEDNFSITDFSGANR